MTWKRNKLLSKIHKIKNFRLSEITGHAVEGRVGRTVKCFYVLICLYTSQNNILENYKNNQTCWGAKDSPHKIRKRHDN